MATAEMKKIAALVAESVKETLDEVMGMDRTAEYTGWSKDYLYRKWPELGGVRRGGKIFFSKRNLNNYIKYGKP